MSIRVFQQYMYQDQLVTVIGAKNMNSPETFRYLIRWADVNGKEIEAEAKAYELSEPPTITDIYEKYMLALSVIQQQSAKIAGLEDQIIELKRGQS